MNNKPPNMTKKQAERVLDTEMITRDFWIIGENNDNLSLLQDVLDTLFNVIEGNDYIAKYSTGQYFTRLVILCKACNKELTSHDPFRAHDKGKHHKKTTNLLISQAKSSPNIFDSVIFRDVLEPLLIFEDGSLEDRIDNTKNNIVGIQFVYKEKRDQKYLFTCQLCLKEKKCFRLSDEEMFAHVCSDSHTLKYMNVVHGFDKGGVEDLQHYIDQVMERQGRIMCKITEFEYSESDSIRYGFRDSNSSPRTSSTASPDPKRRKLAEPLSKEMKPQVTTSDQYCQANIETQTISEFVQELKNCTEEESQIKSLLKDLPQERRGILSQTVQVLSTGMMDFFAYNKDDEFEKLCREFVEMSLKIK